jgi:hypothetical protein
MSLPPCVVPTVNQCCRSAGSCSPVKVIPKLVSCPPGAGVVITGIGTFMVYVWSVKNQPWPYRV